MFIRADRLIPGDVIQYRGADHQIVAINDSESREFEFDIELTSSEREYIGHTMLREVPRNQKFQALHLT